MSNMLPTIFLDAATLSPAHDAEAEENKSADSQAAASQAANLRVYTMGAASNIQTVSATLGVTKEALLQHNPGVRNYLNKKKTDVIPPATVLKY